MGVVSFCDCVHYGCTHVLCMIRALIYSQRVDGGTAEERQERKEFGKKGKEGEKWFEGRASFCFCVTVFFTPSFPSFFYPPCHHSSSYTITHYTPQSTPLHPQHATQAHLCAVLSLSLCVTVSALNPHSIKQHNTMQSWKHHMTQQMDDTRPGLRPQRDSPHLSLRRLCGWHAVSWHFDRNPHN